MSTTIAAEELLLQVVDELLQPDPEAQPPEEPPEPEQQTPPYGRQLHPMLQLFEVELGPATLPIEVHLRTVNGLDEDSFHQHFDVTYGEYKLKIGGLMYYQRLDRTPTWSAYPTTHGFHGEKPDRHNIPTIEQALDHLVAWELVWRFQRNYMAISRAATRTPAAAQAQTDG